MADVHIIEDDLSGAAIRALVASHIAAMQAHSPADKVHALPVDALLAPGVTFYSAWIGDQVAGMGAIRDLGDGNGEIKSMRVAPAFLHQGVGEAMLRHLLGVARTRGYAALYLETGKTAPFAPAIALYRKYGFEPCPAFADYVVDGFSQCMSLTLS